MPLIPSILPLKQILYTGTMNLPWNQLYAACLLLTPIPVLSFVHCPSAVQYYYSISLRALSLWSSYQLLILLLQLLRGNRCVVFIFNCFYSMVNYTYRMNITEVDSNDSIYYNTGNESSDIIPKEESLAFRMVRYYLPLVFRPICTAGVIYASLCTLDAIRKTRKRYPHRFHSIEFFFLINLLISGIVTVFTTNVVALSVIISTLANPDTKGVTCHVIAASQSPLCGTSLFVMLVCFDRLMFITSHDPYVRHMTKRKCYITAGIVWFLTVIGNVVMVFDPTMNIMTTNGVCIHRPFVNHYGTIVLILPAFLAVIMAIIQSIYLFVVAFRSNVEWDRQMNLHGATADDKTDQRRRPSQFLRVLVMSRRSAYTAILLASTHLIFGAVFPFIEYMVCPRFEDILIYDILTSLVFVFFEFMNLMIHPLLYGFYVQMIRENMRHRDFFLWLYQLCCCRLFPRQSHNN